MIKIYDTLQSQKVELKPQTQGKVSLYVCGPTVYSFIHVGNARPLVVYDLVARHLKCRGYECTYLRNITDVDDKIIAQALAQGEEPADVATRFTKAFHEDCHELVCLPPSIEPKATEHISLMVQQIQQLLEKGLAYIVDGNVYFAVNQFAEYGKISKLSVDELLAGVRKEIETGKKNATDFALWKAAKPGELSWDAPFGRGRPGWHIECSAMAVHYLGPTFDIHGGGIDLRFPHHENERAQAQGVYGPNTFAQIWMHNGHVGFRWVHDGELQAEGKKIAKSDESTKAIYEMFMARSCFERYGGEAVRLFLLGTHYSSPLPFEVHSRSGTAEVEVPALEEAERKLEYAYITKQRLDGVLSTQSQGEVSTIPVLPETLAWREALLCALDDDFNTPVALAHWHGALALCNRLLNNQMSPAPSKEVRIASLRQLKQDLEIACSALGLLEKESGEWLEALRARKVKRLRLDVASIEKKIVQREEARLKKDFSTSDALRQELSQMGIEVMDSGTARSQWRIKD